MVFSELGCIIGLHVAMAIWLGVLASAWKGRTTWRWIAIGLLTSVLGLLLLARAKRLQAAPQTETDMQLQHMDGTSLMR